LPTTFESSRGQRSSGLWNSKKKIGAVPNPSDLSPYLKNGQMPVLVVKEIYTINPVWTKATARIPVRVKSFPEGSVLDVDSIGESYR
jgi:hypothetical protein